MTDPDDKRKKKDEKRKERTAVPPAARSCSCSRVRCAGQDRPRAPPPPRPPHLLHHHDPRRRPLPTPTATRRMIVAAAERSARINRIGHTTGQQYSSPFHLISSRQGRVHEFLHIDVIEPQQEEGDANNMLAVHNLGADNTASRHFPAISVRWRAPRQRLGAFAVSCAPAASCPPPCQAPRDGCLRSADGVPMFNGWFLFQRLRTNAL